METGIMPVQIEEKVHFGDILQSFFFIIEKQRGWDNSPISYIKSEQTKILIVRKLVLFAFFVQL
ncbi:hypothetical protein [Streptococcus ruminantium]|uniref:hypothetical protein n=1 Tax=Streptococcus ruminantium TaxID=1917441 RepID=UPI001F2EE1D2|nr:hypothetical protein [Streptococcus ruminantium]BDD38513.1 hypothetical protein GUT183_07510 [Streptococcus ruminantium]